MRGEGTVNGADDLEVIQTRMGARGASEWMVGRLIFSSVANGLLEALDRTQPVLPLRPGIPARQAHDYVRYGTTTLFAALNVLDGTVIGDCLPRHRHGEFLAFLDRIEEETQRRAQRSGGRRPVSLARALHAFCIPRAAPEPRGCIGAATPSKPRETPPNSRVGMPG